MPRTLKNLKINSRNDLALPKQEQSVIEDCQVQTDETSYGDWLIAQGIVCDPKPVNKDMQNGDTVCKQTEDKNKMAMVAGNQTGIDNAAEPQVKPKCVTPPGNATVSDQKNAADILKINPDATDISPKSAQEVQPATPQPQHSSGSGASETLNNLFDELKNYMGSMDTEQCENRIEHLKSMISMMKEDKQKRKKKRKTICQLNLKR